MATQLEHHRLVSGAHLLDRIVSAPALVQAVRELPAPALVRLIDHVGLEDAGELVALAGPDQLREVFDEQLWHGVAGGAEERFDAARFALWLEVMAEAGDAFVARTLSELPVDLLTLAVQRLVIVLDMDALFGRLAHDPAAAESIERALGTVTYEEWESFALVPREARSWDAVWNAMLALDRDHHALLRDVLEHCAFVTEADAAACGGIDILLDEANALEAQVADDRDERRAARGYVSAPDARAFLSLCRQRDYPAARDPITLAHFRRVTSPGDREPAAAQDRGDAGPGAPVQPTPSSAGAPALLELLREAEVLPPNLPVAGFLTTGAGGRPAGFTDLMPALAASDSERHAGMVAELAYLANVLLAVTGRDPGARPVDAMLAAVRVCELGLVDWVPEGDAERRLRVLSEQSADLLFRRGVQRLCRDPDKDEEPTLAPFVPWLVGTES